MENQKKMEQLKSMQSASEVYFWAVKKGRLYDSDVIERIMQLGGLKCQYCQSVFNCPADFIQHICLQETEYYSSFKSSVCCICNAVYTNNQGLKRHYKSMDDEQHRRESAKKIKIEYSCQYCGKKFLRKRSFCLHLEECKDKFNKYCDKVDSEMRDAASTVPQQQGDQRREEIMDLDLADIFDHDFTLEDVDRANQYKCTFCQQLFTTLEDLGRHRDICEANVVYTCDVSMHCNNLKIKRDG